MMFLFSFTEESAPVCWTAFFVFNQLEFNLFPTLTRPQKNTWFIQIISEEHQRQHSFIINELVLLLWYEDTKRTLWTLELFVIVRSKQTVVFVPFDLFP